METIIESFHVDVKILLAQIINFAIVFAVLYYFVFRPLTKMMQERTKKIEKSLVDAKNIEEKLSATNEEYEKIVSDAKKEANGIIEKAMVLAEKKKQETIDKTKEEIGRLIGEEKDKIRLEKGVILKELRSEVADLVVISLEKVLEQKMNDKEDRELIKKLLKK